MISPDESKGRGTVVVFLFVLNIDVSKRGWQAPDAVGVQAGAALLPEWRKRR